MNLFAAITNSATTIQVTETLTATNPPATGVIKIEQELISYTGHTTTANSSFTGCTRGYGGTTAAAHVINSKVQAVYADSTGIIFPASKYVTANQTIKTTRDIPTSKVYLQNVIVGSRWALVQTVDGVNVVRASGQATGTGTVVDVTSVPYENFAPFYGVINIRLAGYLPLEYPVYVNSGVTSVYVSQKADTIISI